MRAPARPSSASIESRPVTRWLRILVLTILETGCVGKKKYDALDAELAAERSRSSALETQLASTTDRASALSQQATALQADVADLERALAELRAREDVAKARVQAYKDLVARFAELINAGTLRVDPKATSSAEMHRPAT